MSFTATQELNDAMLVGGINALVDADVLPAYAVLFGGAAALVTLVFAKPGVVLVSHKLRFVQGDASGDMIFVQGSADNFKLYNGANTLLGSGDVTDMAGAGAMKLSGTTGTLLYAGARAILGQFEFA